MALTAQQLLGIAKLAIEAAEELLRQPPPESIPVSVPEPASKPKRCKHRKLKPLYAERRGRRLPRFSSSTPLPPDPLPPRIHADEPMTELEPKKRRGRPPGALDYICLSCKHGFRAVNPEHCPNPNCGAHENFVLKKDYNPDDPL